MTALVIALALATALCTGYEFGRRTGTTSSARSGPRGRKTSLPWQRRTSRLALGRAAVSLVLLVAARRVQRNVFAQRALSAAVGGRGAPRRRARSR